MLSRSDIKEISEAGSGNSCFVSLYLDVSPTGSPKGEHLIWFKNEVREKARTLDKSVQNEVEGCLQEMEAHMQGNRRDFKRGFAMICSTDGTIPPRVFNLSVSFENLLVIDRSPYIKPLMDVIEQYRRYAVLLVDKESARIFVVQLGEITEYGEVHTADIPGRHKKGGWFALAQTHFDRHVEHHVALHLKDVISRFEAFLVREGIDRVLIGGPEEAIVKTRARLPVSVSENIVDTFSAGMFMTNSEVLERVRPVLEANDSMAADRTMAVLVQRAMKKERAALGLENVLKAVQEGRISKLVLDRGAKAQGARCTGCGALVVRDIPSCPYCGGVLEDINYIVDLAVQKVVEQKAEVEMVSASGDFQRAGGIGAFLRF